MRVARRIGLTRGILGASIAPVAGLLLQQGVAWGQTYTGAAVSQNDIQLSDLAGLAGPITTFPVPAANSGMTGANLVFSNSAQGIPFSSGYYDPTVNSNFDSSNLALSFVAMPLGNANLTVHAMDQSSYGYIGASSRLDPTTVTFDDTQTLLVNSQGTAADPRFPADIPRPGGDGNSFLGVQFALTTPVTRLGVFLPANTNAPYNGAGGGTSPPFSDDSNNVLASAFVIDVLVQGVGQSLGQAQSLQLSIPNEYAPFLEVDWNGTNKIQSITILQDSAIDTNPPLGFMDVYGLPTVNSTWNHGTGGSWGTTSANWAIGAPGSAGDSATFGSTLTSSGIVTLDGTKTLGHLIFNNAAASYTIAQGTGGGSLTIDNTGGYGSPDITVLAGTHAITAPLAIAGAGVNFNFSNGANLMVDNVSGTGAAAAGPIFVTGAGRLTVAPGGSLPASASLTIAGSNTAVALAVNSGSGIGAAHLSTFSQLAINNGATLDVGNNALLINYSGTNTPLVQVASLVSAGHGSNGLWHGNGITSTFAAGVATNNITNVGIGYNEAATVAHFQEGTNASTTFLGTTISTNSTAVLVVPTLYGDITLQGTVNLDDLNIFSANFGKPTNQGWAAGDFLNEGSVTLDDLNLFAANFGKSLGSFPALTPAEYAQGEAILAALSVPEPASLALLALGAGVLLARRRGRARRKASESS